MTKSALFLAALLATTPVTCLAAPASPPASVLSAADASADVALMRRALETVHPGLYRYTPRAEIEAAFARLAAAATQPMTELALHREIALLLATIHCDHTKPELSEAMTAYRAEQPTHLPLRFALIEGRMIVTATDHQAGAPPLGAEIVAINAQPVARVLLSLARAVAYDGDTDQAIAAKLGDDSDLSGDDFNEYYPSFFGFPARWTIDWKVAGDARTTAASLMPISFAHWTALPAPGAAYRGEFYNSIGWRLSGKVARLRIDTFVNYRNPVQPTQWLGGFFAALRAAGTEHLILDLRRNGGGSEDVSVALARYLFNRPFLWSKPLRYKAVRYGDLPDHIDSWGDRDALFNPPLSAFDTTPDGWYDRRPDPSLAESDDDASEIVHQPRADFHFDGRLTILTGPANGSGATRTIAQLKENRGAVLIGEDSAGSAEGPTAGHIFLLTLPASGIKVRIPNAWNRTNIARFSPRLGVAADRLVLPTLADWSAGRDRALEVARDLPPQGDAAALLTQALSGTWRGSLEYRDYGDDGRVVLPTSLSVVGAQLDFGYDDGPGKFVTSREQWTIGEGALAIKGKSSTTRYRVVEAHRAKDGAITLVFDGDEIENGARVAARIIVTRLGAALRISALTHQRGAPYLLRHAYELRAAPSAPSVAAP